MPASAEGQPLSMTIDAGRKGAPIHRYVYGQFTELLHNLFEKGVWAEMLSDRKFFYPVDSSEELVPENRKRNFNWWRPVGPDSSLVMDRGRAFVGEHAPVVQLVMETPRGITQSGLSLRKDRKYTGRIALAGGPEARVQVSLIWDEGPNDRQTIAISSLSHEYTKFPLNLTSKADTENGRLEIVGTGEGFLAIGVASLMPSDNLDGFRADMITLLKGLDSGIYRWPGGNFVSNYDWRDGVGDRDKRPPRYDYAWHTVEYNDVGTDEFMTLCRLLIIDPFICVNAGLGDAHSAAQWVEYTNGSLSTPMGRWRAANGHEEPYDVKWWGVGNEMYGQWQKGHMYIDHFVLKHNMFVQAMRGVDPSIKIVASGATPFETSTTVRHHRPPLPAKLPFSYGTPQDWSGNLLEHCSDNINYLSEHLYPVFDSAFDVDEQRFVPVLDSLIDRVRRTPNRIRCAVEAWEEYLKRMPHLKEKEITLAIDEWTGGNRSGERRDFSRALCAAEGLHEMFRHSDVITMGAYTAFTGCLDYNGSESCYSSTGLVFHLYRHRFGTIPVEVTGNSPQRSVAGTFGVDKPTISSGSDTYPLDVSAALSHDEETLTVAIVNPAGSFEKIDVTFKNIELQEENRSWNISVTDIQNSNIAGEKQEINIMESRSNGLPNKLTITPLCVSLYEFKVKTSP